WGEAVAPGGALEVLELPRASVTTRVQARAASFDCLLSLDSYPLASLSLSGIMAETVSEKHWRKLRRNPGPTPGAPGGRVGPGAGVGVQATADNDYSGGRVAGSAPPWARGGWEQLRSTRYMWMNVDGLGLLDLSPDGNLHSEVLTHQGPEPARPKGPG
ncbi:unnamed protein product, partial [Discosporangium mesarthrocarpum]